MEGDGAILGIFVTFFAQAYQVRQGIGGKVKIVDIRDIPKRSERLNMVDIKLALKSFFGSATMLALVTVAGTGIISLFEPVRAIVLLVAAFVVGISFAAIVFGEPLRFALARAVSSRSLTSLDNKFLVALSACTKRTTVLNKTFFTAELTTIRLGIALWTRKNLVAILAFVVKLTTCYLALLAAKVSTSIKSVRSLSKKGLFTLFTGEFDFCKHWMIFANNGGFPLTKALPRTKTLIFFSVFCNFVATYFTKHGWQFSIRHMIGCIAFMRTVFFGVRTSLCKLFAAGDTVTRYMRMLLAALSRATNSFSGSWAAKRLAANGAILVSDSACCLPFTVALTRTEAPLAFWSFDKFFMALFACGLHKKASCLVNGHVSKMRGSQIEGRENYNR